jgi:hypothetical protein
VVHSPLMLTDAMGLNEKIRVASGRDVMNSVANALHQRASVNDNCKTNKDNKL